MITRGLNDDQVFFIKHFYLHFFPYGCFLQDFENLKFLNFSNCPSVVHMPNLDLTPHLEELDLHGCKNLKRAHESIAYHTKLRYLNLQCCSNLHYFLDVLQSKNLQLLDLAGCSKLRRFPDIPDKIKGLKKLYLQGTSIKELPASIENLVSLEDLYLFYCNKLEDLPSSIYNLPNLENLVISGRPKLIKFPKKEEDLSDLHRKMGFPKLLMLRLGGCDPLEVEFPENHSCFPKLLYLDVSKCRRLQEIGKISDRLRGLLATNCESLCKIPSDIYLLFQTLDPDEEFANTYFCNILLLGGEMPKWLLPNKDGYISFMASKDLYKKFLGLAISVVFRVKEGKQNVRFIVHPYSNGRSERRHELLLFPSHSDHVWLSCVAMEDLWGEDPFGPNDLSSFRLGIKASNGAIVKKCGFRLICKPLEDDLEALNQDDELLDPSLFYEIWHDDEETTPEQEISAVFSDLDKRWIDHEDNYQTSSEEDCISEMEEDDVQLRNYSRIYRSYINILPGVDMPEEFVPVEGGTISFMVSQDFYDKFLGLALCVVFNVEDREKEIFFDIVPHVNGQRRNVLSGALGSFHSDHMWIQYIEPNVLWGVLEGAIDFLEFDEDYLQFSLTLTLSSGTMEKLGYVLICEQLDDDLKGVLEDNQLVDPASLREKEYREFLRKFLPRLMKEVEEYERSTGERLVE